MKIPVRSSLRVSAFLALISLGILLLGFSCTQAGSGNNPVAVKSDIIPKAGPGIRLYGQEGGGDSSDVVENGINPRIKLDASEVFQQIYQANLDSDAEEEQIIVFKNKDDHDSLLRIMVVDYDAARSLWAEAWQGVTRATNTGTFQLRTIDLTLGGFPEIVCSGWNTKGEQTLDIFRMSATNFPVQYTSVLSVSADVSVDLVKPGSGDSTDPETGAPLPKAQAYSVLSLTKDLESQNPMDMVQTVYLWKQSQGQYIISQSSKIPGAKVQEAQLDQLYQGDVSDFENFLGGAWQRSFSTQKQKKVTQLIYFDPLGRSVQLLQGDLLESHEWLSTHKPPYGGRIQIFLQNENFKSLKSTASISPSSVNSIDFALQDRDDWTGEFDRISQDSLGQIFSGSDRNLAINTIALNGLYRTEDGIELIFNSPRFTWRNGEDRRQGAYLSYNLNNPVLELKFINAKGLVEGDQLYIATLTETSDAQKRTTRTLDLRPARLSVDGVQASSTDVLHLVQTPGDVDQ